MGEQKMRYSLIAIALVTLALTACDQFKEHKPGDGKPGQYPPSLWDKREGMVEEPPEDAVEAAPAEAAPAKP